MKRRGLSSRGPTLRAWSIPSRLEAVDEVCEGARRLLEEQGLSDKVFAVELLFREFLNNSIIHGHAGDPSKEVRASLRVGRRWLVIEVEDEGPGFDWRNASRRIPDISGTSGRGLAIGRLYATRLRFSRKGNRIGLWLEK